MQALVPIIPNVLNNYNEGGPKDEAAASTMVGSGIAPDLPHVVPDQTSRPYYLFSGPRGLCVALVPSNERTISSLQNHVQNQKSPKIRFILDCIYKRFSA